MHYCISTKYLRCQVLIFHLLGRTVVGRGSVIEPNTVLRDATLGEGVRVKAGARLGGVKLEPGITVGE